MSGPVWRFDRTASGACSVCGQDATGLFVEGEVIDNTLHALRQACRVCYQREQLFLVSGEAGRHTAGPAYARR